MTVIPILQMRTLTQNHIRSPSPLTEMLPLLGSLSRMRNGIPFQKATGWFFLSLVLTDPRLLSVLPQVVSSPDLSGAGSDHGKVRVIKINLLQSWIQMDQRSDGLTARRTPFNPVFVHANYRLMFRTLLPSLPILLDHISGGEITHVTSIIKRGRVW